MPHVCFPSGIRFAAVLVMRDIRRFHHGARSIRTERGCPDRTGMLDTGARLPPGWRRTGSGRSPHQPIAVPGMTSAGRATRTQSRPSFQAAKAPRRPVASAPKDFRKRSSSATPETRGETPVRRQSLNRRRKRTNCARPPRKAARRSKLEPGGYDGELLAAQSCRAPAGHPAALFKDPAKAWITRSPLGMAEGCR